MRLRSMGLVVLMISTFLSSITPLDSKGINNWEYRLFITVDNTNNPQMLTDYQVCVEFDSNSFNFSHAQPDGDDLRFADRNGNTLSYWIEFYDSTNKKARIWVKMDIVPASGKTDIVMYFSNPTAAAASDGCATFAFFDDFEDNDISDWKTEMWGNYNGDTIAENNQLRLRVYRCYNVEVYKDIGTYSTQLAFRYDWKTKTDNWWEYPGWKVLENGIEVSRTVLSGTDVQVGRAITKTGTVEAKATLDGSSRLLYGIYQSIYCVIPDHANTYFWIDNIRVRKYTEPEPTVIVGPEIEIVGNNEVGSPQGGSFNQMLRPLAFFRISRAESLQEESHSLLQKAIQNEVDVSEVEPLIENADMYLADAKENYLSGNYIAANNLALQAIELYIQAISILENLS
ncbi:MAG: DUF2341 domain-containing protein [Theionarchaea archaeon]|nr:DUF2341 domain-containing protein [Theionarchaea archaeon]